MTETHRPPRGSHAPTWLSLGALAGLIIGGGAVWLWHRPGTMAHEGPAEAAAPTATQPTMQPATERVAEDDILYWTCGMHPSVRSDGPGKCPICNMDLVPVRASEQAGGGAQEPGTGPRVTLPADVLRSAPIETVPVAFRDLDHEINTSGRLVLNEQRVSHVHTRVAGWIDDVFVEYTGAEVAPGDPMVSIYSEDLVTAQEEYLLALQNRDRLGDTRFERARQGAEALVEAARQRLLRWEITPQQVDELERTGQPQDHLILYYSPPPDTPHGGVVIDRMAVEGMRVERGDQLYTVADLSTLWMLADVYESEIAWVAEGQRVDVTTPAYPARVFEGHITFIEPMLDAATRTLRVRVEVDNPHMELRPEMYVDARILIPLDRSNQVLVRMRADALERWRERGLLPPTATTQPTTQPTVVEPVQEATVLSIPDVAVLRTGRREIVYVEESPGTYAGREVITGPSGYALVDGQRELHVPVLVGLEPGMRVVARGNFMIDSQTTLTGAASAAYGSALETGGGSAMPPGHQH